MFKRQIISYLTMIFAAVCILVNFTALPGQQQNQPPVVKIITPKNNSSFEWDTPISYSISVSDGEDGDSKFDEINGKEVLLEVRRAAKPSAGLKNAMHVELRALTIMRTSNCFNCHNFNSPGIGPSFYSIGKRYPLTKANTDTLVKRIRAGSTGVWGKEKMPTHTELSREETKVTVRWIMQHAADQDVNYYIGIEGSFRIKKPAFAKQKGVYVLTASYVDHGLKDAPGKLRLRGEDKLFLRGGKMP